MMKCKKSKIFEHVRKKQSFFQTKAQGLSLNTIIIAAIVLIVLIVLWAIFTGRMGKFTAGLKSEEEKAQAEAKKFEQVATGGVSVGQACEAGSTPACDSVGNNLLRCNAQNKWEVQYTCANGCDITKNVCK